MAQVKKKRQTKHRGNAAGMIESRGRTGRKPTDAEKKGSQAKATATKSSVDRRDLPPTWKKAFLGALFAAVMLFAIMALAFNKPAQGAIMFPFVLAMYVPISYYTDSFFYKRRLAQKGRGRAR